jgi:tetratricopeptide (TPR) repeat protein
VVGGSDTRHPTIRRLIDSGASPGQQLSADFSVLRHSAAGWRIAEIYGGVVKPTDSAPSNQIILGGRSDRFPASIGLTQMPPLTPTRVLSFLRVADTWRGFSKVLGERRLCTCGSGLGAARCCEMPPGALPAPGAGRPLTPMVERASELLRQGAATEARQLCVDVLELAPGHPDALTVLYQICRDHGPPAAAEALLRRIVTLHPNTFWAVNDLALLALSKGAVFETELHARNAIRIAPENPQSHNLMGIALTESNRPHTGEYHYRKVLELTRRRDPLTLANIAWNLKNQGRIDESRALYEEATAAEASLHTLLGWARMEEADRNLDRALQLLDRAEQLAPDNPSILLLRAVVYGRSRDYRRALAVLDRLAEKSGADGLGANELLEKGRLLDQMGRYDEAWDAFVEGKRLCRERGGLVYRNEAAQQLIERLKNFFNEGRMNILPRAGLRDDVAQPVFILGFPRSGTTLVEQTLSAHPRISAGDELPFVNEITDAMVRSLNSPMNYPEALAELWMGDRRHGLDELRDYYLGQVRRLGIVEPGAAWFTDKMPLNEIHLGLIALMFPRAPLIHVVRHPLDIMLSVFSNNLTHGFYCAFGLETAALHYRRVMELVDHYRSVLTLHYLPIRYEDIVDDQAQSTRRMLEFVGEPFDPACLSFHENRRYARTASYAQVTEPLYDRSRYRYRHYLKHLQPAIDILAPVIERLGYRLD